MGKKNLLPMVRWLDPLNYTMEKPNRDPSAQFTEIQRVREVQSQRNPRATDLALRLSNLDDLTFRTEILKAYEAKHGPEKAREAAILVNRIVMKAEELVTIEKLRYPRSLRPYLVDSSIIPVGGLAKTVTSNPSGHAASAYAEATVLAELMPELTALIFTKAANVSRSRVYMGVHAPGDVAEGARFGVRVALRMLADRSLLEGNIQRIDRSMLG